MYNPLMELSDPRTMHPDHPPPTFLKKKRKLTHLILLLLFFLCEACPILNQKPFSLSKVSSIVARAKSQHSAPRGGPPRSWTNAELTKALEHVWNKKMTTSQASRIFGIPYNSLLMYVRGKYGKSLKLENLRKDCISGPPIEIIQRGISGHVTSKERSHKDSKDGSDHHGGGGGGSGGPRSSSSEPDLLSSPNPFFGSFPPGFYPDFSEGFPRLPLDMSSLLASERPPGPHVPMSIDDDCRSNGSKQSTEDDFRDQPLALSRNANDEQRDNNNSLNTSNSTNNQPMHVSKPCVRL